MYILGWQFCKVEEISAIFSQYLINILVTIQTKVFISIIVPEKLELIKRSNEINKNYNTHDNNDVNNCIDNVVLIVERVIQDYDNTIDTFLKHCKYFVFYKLNNNKYIYTNNISDSDNNYAIKWNGDDIDQFVEESPIHVFQNKHDGLMFFISSPDDRDKVTNHSESKIYKLECIFSMHLSQASVLLESYTESQQESSHLLSIPKIIFLDVGHGNQNAKVAKIETQKNETIQTETTTMDDERKKEATKDVVIDEMKKQESKARNKTETSELKSQTTQRSFEFGCECTNILAQQNKNKEETQGHLTNCTLFLVPGPMGKGVLVQTTLSGNLILVPTARDVHNSKTLSQTKDEILSFILSKTKGMVPSIEAPKVIHSFAGAPAKSDRRDSIIEMSISNNYFINDAGIDSPGLVGSPAVALYVDNMIQDFCQRDKHVSMNRNGNFDANRKPLIFPERVWVRIKLKTYKPNDGNKCQWIEEEIAQMKKDVICKCDKVTEYEIKDTGNTNSSDTDLPANTHVKGNSNGNKNAIEIIYNLTIKHKKLEQVKHIHQSNIN